MENINQVSLSRDIYQQENQASKHAYLFIDLPQFDFPVIFKDRESKLPSFISPFTLNSEMSIIYDAEASRDNLAETMHRKLGKLVD